MEKVTGPAAPNKQLMRREAEEESSWACFDSLKDAIDVQAPDSTALPPEWAQKRWEYLALSNPCSYRAKNLKNGACGPYPCDCCCGCLLCPYLCPMALGSGAACALGRAVTLAEGEEESCCGLCCGLGEQGCGVCCRVCCPIALTGLPCGCSWLGWKMTMAQRKAIIKEYGLRESPDVRFCCHPCELWRQSVFLHEVEQKAVTWRGTNKSFEIETRATSAERDASPSKSSKVDSRKSRKVDASFLAVSHLSDDRPRSSAEDGWAPKLETEESATL